MNEHDTLTYSLDQFAGAVWIDQLYYRMYNDPIFSEEELNAAVGVEYCLSGDPDDLDEWSGEELVRILEDNGYYVEDGNVWKGEA